MMKTDRELLELAAKACGWKDIEFQDMRGWGEVRYGLSEGVYVGDINEYWNPLTNDGDALRLAVKLHLHVFNNDPREYVLWVSAVLDKKLIAAAEEFLSESVRLAATRRAIVRAAAAIQQAKEAL